MSQCKLRWPHHGSSNPPKARTEQCPPTAVRHFPAVVAVLCLLATSGEIPAIAADEIHKVAASDGAAYDHFGLSIAVSGYTAVVGAMYDDDNGVDSGAAYVFDVTTGTELFKLTASDGMAGDEFGISVGIDGTIAVVGAWSNGAEAAYVFDITTGNELFKLTTSDPGSLHFGNSVAVSGNIAIVGAFASTNVALNDGSAYIFDVTTGNELFKLTASDGTARDYFGTSVAISGNTAVVGAYIDNSQTGSAYVFDVTTGNELFKLTASDGATGDHFGNSVAVSGNSALIGAWDADASGADSGSAYIFDVTTGDELFKLSASDGSANDRLGNYVAISGDTAVVGAFWDDDNGHDSGSAYIFDVTTGSELFKLTASGPRHLRQAATRQFRTRTVIRRPRCAVP